MYRDPGDIVEGLLRRGAVVHAPAPAAGPALVRDRYYTQARRFHVKQLMRGKG
jgi:hypothetical protein